MTQKLSVTIEKDDSIIPEDVLRITSPPPDVLAWLEKNEMERFSVYLDGDVAIFSVYEIGNEE